MTKNLEMLPPDNLNFGDLLKWLLTQGMRPHGSQDRGMPWKTSDFAKNVGRSPKQVFNWLKNDSLPDDILTIERIFFGTNQDNFQFLRMQLRTALQETRINRVRLSQYANLSIVELMWNEIASQGVDLKKIPEIESSNLDDIAWAISEYNRNLSYEDAKATSKLARAHIFDVKYGKWTADHDERHIIGIESWNREIEDVFKKYNVDKTGSMLCVGVGCGLEGVDIYDKFDAFIGLDISKTALESASKIFPKMEICESQAEFLPQKDETVDVYISLKTYQSSFFDIRSAISSCARVLKRSGVVVISIPRGYYFDGMFFPGLCRTNYNLASAKRVGTYRPIDKLYPFDLINSIVSELYRRLFCDIQINTGLHEYYICARRN